ncbi:MAG: sodium/solute symporter [Planctomycetes bacterium]|nr:sodium/solute symporter [Planctomycetota bacterium]
MDLSQAKEKREWVSLESFPGNPRVQPAVAAQNNGRGKKLYLFGGFSNTSYPGPPFVSTDGYSLTPPKKLEPGAGIWEKIAEVNTPTTGPLTVSGGFAIAYGAHHIIVIGGVNKESFTSHIMRENSMKAAQGDALVWTELKMQWTNYMSQAPEAFAFNPYVMAYHTVTNTWHKLQDYPFSGPAGAPLVKWNNNLLVVNGEIMPGVRTSRIALGKMDNNPTFGTINYIVLVGYLMGMLLVGYYFMKRENGTEDFFKGGGRIPWWAAGISIFATMLSSITFMAIPAMTYEKHWMPFITAVAILLTAPFIIKFYLPFFRKLNVTTAYEYLEKRFNSQVRIVASVMFMVFKVVRIGVVSYLPAVALTAVTGINIDACMIFIGIITMVYCTMGGVEAVIWGDVIQGITLVLGALLAAVYLVLGTDGGLIGMIETGNNHDKWHLLDFSLDFTQPVFWVCIIGGLGINIASYSGDQSVVQRYLTTNNEKEAAKGIMLNGLLAIPISFLFYFIGTALYSYYRGRPEELSIVLDKPNAIFPYFIMQELPIGVAGLLIAAVFSATMSTLSSDLNSAATAFTTDIYRKMKPSSSDHQCLVTARISTVVFGLLGCGFALYTAHAPTKTIFELFNQYVGLLVGGLGGLFLMGIFTRRINGTGAMISFMISILVVFSVKEFTPINGWMYGFIAMGTCVISGLTLSLFLKQSKNIEGLTL